MSEKKGWGSTVAGWFIERDDNSETTGEAEAEADMLGVAPASGDYEAPSPTQTVFQTAPPPPTGGQVIVQK